MNKIKKAIMLMTVLLMVGFPFYAHAQPVLNGAAYGASLATGGPAAGSTISNVGGTMVYDASNTLFEMATNQARAAEMTITSGLIAANTAIVTAATATLVPDWFLELLQAYLKVSTGISSALGTASRVQATSMGALSDADVLNTLLEAEEKVARKQIHAPNELLCKKIQLANLAQITKPFTNAVSQQVQRSLAALGRGPEDDMSGPLFAVDMENSRCDLGAGHPLDGYEGDCIKGVNVKASSYDITLTDADVSPHKAMSGLVPLQMPPVKQKTTAQGVKVVVPDPQTPEQKMWLAGYYYCIQLQGPRLSPLWGDNIDTIMGRPQRAMFEHALARQSVYNKSCADLLAYYTAPNPDEYPQLVETQHFLCANARGIISESELASEYGNCIEGLSLYQAERLQHRLCKAENYTIDRRSLGTTDKEMPDGMIDCATSWIAWKRSVAERQGALVEAVTGQQKIKQSWPTNMAMGIYSGQPSYASAKGIKKKAKVRKVKTEPIYTPVVPDVLAQ